MQPGLAVSMSQARISRIVLETSASKLELPVREHLVREIIGRLDAAHPSVNIDWLGELLAYRLLGSLVAESPSERPPSDAQLKYAIDLAAKHGVEIPVLALKRRSHMGAFISTYASLS